MKVSEIRKCFIEYFLQRDHKHLPSSRLLPDNDPTLLFTNAGMNPFKNIFLGLEKPNYPRAVTVQKCVRAGGKHNDLEKVGYTARHHTFFEMLGNFSFGDYFKKEAIHYAWDFLTQTLSLPKDKLWVTVFDSDDEAFDIWHKQEGVPRNRIYRFGEKDNFWRMGEGGPCGPCSEVYYDLGESFTGADNILGGEGDRYMEVWNLVFMQFCEDEGGQQRRLTHPAIDTGAGLERLASVLQGQVNNYHIDLFQNLISAACEWSSSQFNPKTTPGTDPHKVSTALKILADHARAVAFLIADGTLPSNEGRGYVLRRIIRRAVRYGQQLMKEEGLLLHVVHNVITEMRTPYTELTEQKDRLLSVVQDEERRFLKTLDQGNHLLQQALKKLPQSGPRTLHGEVAFKLYDTYGFPLDLTRLIAREQGVQVDEAGFQNHMQTAKEKAKASWKVKSLPKDKAHMIASAQQVLHTSGPTQFVGYTQTCHTSQVLLLSNGIQVVEAIGPGGYGFVVTDASSFYAEGGGQVGDSGILSFPQGRAQVMDCTQQNEVFFHHFKVLKGEIKTGMTVKLQVEVSQRRATARNHSATHLLNAALRKVLGSHVIQAGSHVDGERLRFDFTHPAPLSVREIKEIESWVNGKISRSIDVDTKVMNLKEAQSTGALALFGEKYNDPVRVVQMGEFSMELCGGTHVSNTSLIRVFKIVSEGSVSAGVRRIDALTGDRAIDYLLKHTEQSVEIRQHLDIHEKWDRFMAPHPAGDTSAGDQRKEQKPGHREVTKSRKDKFKDKSHTRNALIDWAQKIRGEIKSLEKKIKQLKSQAIDFKEILDRSHNFVCHNVHGKLVLADVDVEDRQTLKDVMDRLRHQLTSGVIVVMGKGSQSHPIIVNVSEDLTEFLHAGQLLKKMVSLMGGKGGGRADSAQGVATNRHVLQKAFGAIKDEILNVEIAS